MSRHLHDRVLPPFLLRMMEVLERLSSSTPIWRSVITISVTGVLLTTLVSAWIWHAQSRQEAHEFGVVAQVLQERLNAST